VAAASIAILTFADDLHALAIQDRLRTFPGTTCDLVEVDAIADHARGITWSTLPDAFPVSIPTRDGGSLDVQRCDAIWFRRWNHPQRAARTLDDTAHREVVNASTTSALLGALLTQFQGAWVSDPEATSRAENKLVQLRAAQLAGFKVPRTLVSQNPQEIRQFCDRLDGRAILKTLRATPSSQLFTLKVTTEHLADDQGLRLCPTIFQEYVPGTTHVRALCCGTDVHAVTIVSPDLDWRLNMNVPVTPVTLTPEIESGLGRVLEILGLKMGIVDLKIDETGEPVWLELNPQGQFLFVEGLTGVDLTGAFSKFLHREALIANHARR
jgi:glutathione synthase/RimK-type ligase-like ATP-grasp enzyme